MLQHFAITKVAEHSPSSKISLRDTHCQALRMGFRRCKRLSTFMWQVRHQQRRQRGGVQEQEPEREGLPCCPLDQDKSHACATILKLSANEIWAAAVAAARQSRDQKMASNLAGSGGCALRRLKLATSLQVRGKQASVFDLATSDSLCCLEYKSSCVYPWDCLIRGTGTGTGAVSVVPVTLQFTKWA